MFVACAHYMQSLAVATQRHSQPLMKLSYYSNGYLTSLPTLIINKARNAATFILWMAAQSPDL